LWLYHKLHHVDRFSYMVRYSTSCNVDRFSGVLLSVAEPEPEPEPPEPYHFDPRRTGTVSLL
jgi:hypothetical protein